MSKNNQKFSRLLEITSKADFSSLISEMKKVQVEAKKHGTSNNELFNIDSSIEKMEELQLKIKQAISKGFSNPKDANDFEKMLNHMVELAGNVQTKFERINIKELNNKVKELKNNLEKIDDANTKILDSIEKSLRDMTSSSKQADVWAKGLKEAVKEGKNYEDIEKRINRSLKERIKTQQELLDKTKATRKEADFNKNKSASIDSYSQISRNSFVFTDAKGQANEVAPSRWDKVKPIFKSIATSGITDANQALELFEQRLKAIGVTIKGEYRENLKNVFSVMAEDIQKFSTQSEQAKNSLEEIKTRLQNLSKEQQQVTKFFSDQGKLSNLVGDFSKGTQDASKLRQELAEVEAVIANNVSPKWLQQLNSELIKAEEEADKTGKELEQATDKQIQFEKFSDSISNFASRIMSLTTAFYQFRRVISNTYNDVKQLDKAFGSIAMVTSYSVRDLWQQYGTYAEMANRLGQTTQGIVEASSLYYQQGLETAEVMSLTEETMKLATLAGLDFKEATSQMTAAIRAFKLEMTDGAHVTDVYAELAAHAAASVNDISQAMSATAAIAHSAGMEFETTSAMLTTMIEATQEAPKNLGTALKAVIARFTELKKNIAGTSESEFDDLDYNKVDTALKSVGVQLKDTNGQFRDLDDVFRELAAKWDTLDRNSQRYVATIAAGSRQQSRFIALMENSARMEELIATAYDSAGKSSQQFAKFQDTVEFKVNRLKNTWEQARTEFFSSDFYKDLIDFGNEALGRLKGLDFGKLLAITPIFFTIGRKLADSWVEGFKQGAGTLKSAASKVVESITGKRIQTTQEIQKNYRDAQNRLAELRVQQLISVQNQARNREIYNQQGLGREHALNGIAVTPLNDLEQVYTKLQETRNQEVVNIEEVNQYKQKLKDLVEQYKTFGSEAWLAEKTASEGMEKLTQEEREAKAEAEKLSKTLANRQIFNGIGSAIGSSLGTGISMGIMGTFNAEEIFKTIVGQNLVTAASQLFSGNWQAALGTGLISVASLGIGKLIGYFEERAEKERLASDKAYALKKENEKLSESEEELSEKVNTANEAFEKQKKIHEDLTSAIDTYEELSNKISRTEEEQQELNKAVEVLISYNSNLILGYDEQGNAIFKMGQQWDDVIEKEKEAYDLALKNKVFSDVELAKNQRQQAETNLQIFREYKKAIDDYNRTKPTESNELNYIRRQLSLDFAASTDQFRIEQQLREVPQQYRSVIEAAAEQVGLSFEKYAEIGDLLEEDEYIDKFKQFQKLLSDWISDSDTLINTFVSDINDANLKLQEIQKYNQSIINNTVERLLSKNTQYKNLTEQDQKQFLQIFKNQYFDTTEKIQKAIDDGPDLTIASLINEDTLLKEFSITTDKFKIAELLKDLYTLTPEEARDIVSNLNIGSALQEYLLNQINEVEQNRDEIISKISSILFKPNTSATNPGEEYQSQYNYQQSIKNSPIIQWMKSVGFEAANTFINSFANYTEDQQKLVVNSLNDLLGNSLKGIDSNILSNLMNISWQTMSVTDLNSEKKKFLEFAEAQGTAIEIAEGYWNEYRSFMSNLGILDIAKEVFSGDALLTQLEESLDEKLKSAKVSDVIANSIRNGFINFSDSNTFRKACEQMGLNAADFIEEGIGGLEKINVDAFEQAIKDQQQSEEEVIEILKAEYEEKINILNQEEAIIKANMAEGDQVKNTVEAVNQLGNAYNYAATKAWALSQGLNPKDVEGETKTFTVSLDNSAGEAALASIKTQREAYKKIINEDLVSGSQFMKSYMARTKSYYQELLSAVAEGRKSGLEAYSDLEQAKLDQEKADQALMKAEQDLADKAKAVTKAFEDMNKAMYGDSNRVSKLDGLNNYSAILDDISRKATKAKERLDDLSEGDNVDQLLATYTTEIHNEVVVRNAEDEAIKQAIANAEAQLAPYSEFWDKFGDTYVINYEKLNAARDVADSYDYSKIQDKIEEDIEKLRDWTKTLQDNEDAIEKIRKQFEEDQKKALQNYVSMEKEVIETLKEQYEKQVDDLKDRNEAMKDADDDYLNALEKAINKERDLRNRQNQWDDLAKKEKKLSLMQRDTSGSQQVEALQLQEEIEKDRTQLFDDSVDDIIDSLKEMYELQQESREAETEYMEAMLDNAALIEEANSIIQSWGSNEDAVNWFLTNKDLSEMSVAEIELEKKNWNDLYEAKVAYEKQSRLDFDNYLEATQAEINAKMEKISEDITGWSEKTWNTIKEEAEEALYSAKKAYEDAVQSYEDQGTAIEKLQMEADAAKDFYLSMKALMERMTGLSLDDDDITPEKIAQAYATKTNAERMMAAAQKNSIALQKKQNDDNQTTVQNDDNNSTNYYMGKQTADYYKQQGKGNYNYDAYVLKRLEWSERNRSAIQWYGSSPLIWSLDDDAWKDSSINSLSKVGEALAKQGYHGYINDNKIYIYDKNVSVPYPTVNSAEDARKMKGYSKFAQGGLVNYTGPAWVDGSPSNPEAFLSVDDTRLIGNLVNLLSNIPSLNPNTNPTQFSTSNIGDTTINLTVNFDSVSEDYDADRVIDLMKEKIVEAANYTGANIILNKR